MIDLLYYKNKYFENNIFILKKKLLDDFRNNGIKENKQINNNYINYYQLNSMDLLKLISDKVFFFKTENNNSIKNMLYQNKIFYQVFNQESQLESYLYRLINESVNRTLIFIEKFSNKNHPNRISKESIEELINNMDNDIIYLSNQIILIRYQVYLPWLWECRNNPFQYLKKLNNLDSKIKTYHLLHQWDFDNIVS